MVTAAIGLVAAIVGLTVANNNAAPGPSPPPVATTPPPITEPPTPTSVSGGGVDNWIQSINAICENLIPLAVSDPVTVDRQMANELRRVTVSATHQDEVSNAADLLDRAAAIQESGSTAIAEADTALRLLRSVGASNCR